MPGFFVFVILGIRLSWREQYAEIDHEPRDDKPHIEGYYVYGGEVEGIGLIPPAHRCAQIAPESVLKTGARGLDLNA